MILFQVHFAWPFLRLRVSCFPEWWMICCCQLSKPFQGALPTQKDREVFWDSSSQGNRGSCPLLWAFGNVKFLQALALDLRFCKNPFCWVILKECLNIHLHSKRRCHKWNGQSIEIILFHLGFPELSFCFEVFAVWLLILLTKGNFQNQKMSLTKHPESKKMKEASEEVNEALSFTEFFLTHSAIISVFPLQSLRLTILGGFSSFKQNRQMPDSLQLSSFQATFKRMTPSTLLWFL